MHSFAYQLQFIKYTLYFQFVRLGIVMTIHCASLLYNHTKFICIRDCLEPNWMK